MTVETMRAEDEKSNRGLSNQNHDLPVLTASKSVAAIEESSGFIDPAGCISAAVFGKPQRPDKETQQACIHDDHERENQDDQCQMVSSKALQTSVHGPVADLLYITRSGDDIIDADAESHAESCLDHCNCADVPKNHNGQQQSLCKVLDWPLYAVEEREGRPEESKQKEGDAWYDADDNDECRCCWVQEAVFGAQTHNRASNAL